MRFWSWFGRGKRAKGAGDAARVAPGQPLEQKTSTPEQVADLKGAWADLAEAAKVSTATGFHACSRGGKAWQEDPAAVRSVAMMLRRFGTEDTPTDGVPVK